MLKKYENQMTATYAVMQTYRFFALIVFSSAHWIACLWAALSYLGRGEYCRQYE